MGSTINLALPLALCIQSGVNSTPIPLLLPGLISVLRISHASSGLITINLARATYVRFLALIHCPASWDNKPDLIVYSIIMSPQKRYFLANFPHLSISSLFRPASFKIACAASLSVTNPPPIPVYIPFEKSYLSIGKYRSSSLI